MEKSKRSKPSLPGKKLTSIHEGAPPNDVLADSSPSLQPPPKKELQDLLKGYRIKIKIGTKRVVLFRFLLSKMVYDDLGLSIEEFFTIHELYFHLIDMDDPNCSELSRKLQSPLVVELFRKVRNNRIFPYRPWESTRQVMESLVLEILYQRRSYFRMKGQNLTKSFILIFNQCLIPRRFPPKPYIGIGYKDKGSRRKTHEDGSQSWQEIATYFSNKERIDEESLEITSEKSEAET